MKSGYMMMIIGGCIGAIAGWLYWKFVGCASGTCPITARPLTSTLYGALMGALLLSAFTPEKNKAQKPKQSTEKYDQHA